MSYELRISDIRHHGLQLCDDETFIYTLMDDDICIYAGQTKSLKTRLYSHLSSGKEFTSVVVYICTDDQANNEEAKTIVQSGTILNGMLPKNDLFVPLQTLATRMTKLITEEIGSLGSVYSSPASAKKIKYIAVAEGEEIMQAVFEMIKNYKAIEADK